MGRTSTINIKLTDRETRIIEKIINSGKTPSSFRRRLSFVYHRHQGMSLKDICSKESCDLNTAKRWLRRWKPINEYDDLNQKIGDSQFIKLINSLFLDSPRTGTPGHLTVQDKIRVQALSCESPDKYGYPVTNWSHELLSTQAKKMGIEISSSHVGVVLKKRFTTP